MAVNNIQIEDKNLKKPVPADFGRGKNPFFKQAGVNKNFGGGQVRRDFTGFRRGSR